MKIRIVIGHLTLGAELNDTPTARKVAGVLPLKASFNTWGDEIYFPVPVEAELDKSAREEVETGDLGYWPTGRAFCIFFGQKPYSPVNVLGILDGDPKAFAAVKSGDSVKLEQAEAD